MLCLNGLAFAKSPNILVMFSESIDLPFNKKLTDHFKLEVARKFPDATLNFEYLDLSNIEAQNHELLRQYIFKKYANISLDAIVYSGSQAFSLMHSKETFKANTAQFLASFSRNITIQNGQHVPYTLLIKDDYQRLVLEALQLSKSEKLFVIVKTNTKMRLTNVDQVKNTLNNLFEKDKIEFVEFTTLSDVVAYINAQAFNSAVIITPFDIELDNRELAPTEIIDLLASQINVPVYVHWDSLISEHVLGGYVVSSELIAKEMALAIEHIYEKRIPSLNGENIYSHIYNAPVLDEYEIDINDLPTNAVVINTRANPLDLFFTEIVLGLILISVLSITSIVLFTWNKTLKTQQARLNKSELDLQNSNERLKAATNTAELGIWEYTIETNDLYWDAWMFRLHNLNPEKFSPSIKNWLSIIDSLHSGDFNAALLLSINKGTSLSQEYEFALNEKQTRYLSVQAEALFNLDEEPIRIVGTVQDITQQKMYEAEIEIERQKAEAAVRSKSQFIASMGHEIRTPMNAIIGSAGLLNNTELTPQQRNHTELISTSAKSLVYVVNDILDLTRIESGKLQIDKYEFDLQELLQQTILSFQHDSRSKGLQLTLHVQDALPKIVNSDGLRIKQVLYNLIGNAIKFTQLGFVKLIVEFDTVENDAKGMLRFIVSDSGKGISKEAQAHIFKKFEQKDDEDLKRYGGSGLSLHISHQIAKLMSGYISVESALHEGSQFVFSLPVSLPVSEKFKKINENPEVVPNLENKRVLVVDDVESNRMIISYMMAETNAIIVFAENGEQALEISEDQDISLIIMDILMPEMDGIEATKLLRKRELETQKTHLPIIGLTAQEVPGDRELCLEIGMNAYLPKPITRFELFDIINKLI